MNLTIITKTYGEPPFCEKEILRYAGCKSSDDELLQLLRASIEEVRGKLVYKVCYRELPVTIENSVCDFGGFHLQSKNLAQNLQNCNSVILFAATIGVEIDRLIAKYGRISPSKALMLQAIGAERIEALCDVFCADIAKEKQMKTKPRFSPGYGDLALEAQRDFFKFLDCSKQIGLSLNDSLLMSPSKSVTAFLGLVDSEKRTDSKTSIVSEKITDEEIKNKANKCAACAKADCIYRGVI